MQQESITKLVEQVDGALKALDIKALEKQRDELKAKTEQDGFWDDNQKASKTMQKLSELQERIDKWQAISREAKDLLELSRLDDQSLENELQKQFDNLKKRFEKAHHELAYSGPYDEHNAVVSIFAGAGGVDAQDWASMLLRMYLRWAENSGFKTSMLDESSGDEAGIKSVSFEVSGPLVYGKLKGEHGVHRLVRLSPFNANNLRQTSFAKVEVLPEIDEPQTVPLDEKDLKIDVFRAGGHGGQSVNTTDSAVRVTHLPTGITVSIQNERSQIQNKETALTILRSKLAQLQMEQHKENIADIKGPNKSAEWGNQIRSYVLHPYKQVKDMRTRHETSNAEKVLDGDIDGFIEAYLSSNQNS